MKGKSSLVELKSHWDKNHQVIKSYVDSFDSKTLNKAFFEHSVAGPLTLEQAIHLDYLHLNLHIKQVKKLQLLLEQIY